MRQVVSLIKETFSEWSEDKVPRLGAALAYYTVFSIAPLLIIVIALAGFFLGDEAVQGRIVESIQGFVGESGARSIEEMIAGASDREDSIVATVLGVLTLVLGASGVFGQLQDSLNTIWEVKPKPGRGVMGIIKDRFFSFTMVLGTGFLLLVSLVLTTALSAMGEMVSEQNLPGGEALWQAVTFAVSLGVITVMFAMLFKYVPDAIIAWRDVWIGAFITAVLFTLGKSLIGLYLGKSNVGSTFGAAGSLVIVLVWIYYSSQILFLGAEFTQVYANSHGSRVLPSGNAMPVSAQEREQQGIPHSGSTERQTPKPAEPSRDERPFVPAVSSDRPGKCLIAAGLFIAMPRILRAAWRK